MSNCIGLSNVFALQTQTTKTTYTLSNEEETLGDRNEFIVVYCTQIVLGHRTVRCSLVPGNNAKARFTQTQETYVILNGDFSSTNCRRICNLKVVHAEEKIEV